MYLHTKHKRQNCQLPRQDNLLRVLTEQVKFKERSGRTQELTDTILVGYASAIVHVEVPIGADTIRTAGWNGVLTAIRANTIRDDEAALPCTCWRTTK